MAGAVIERKTCVYCLEEKNFQRGERNGDFDSEHVLPEAFASVLDSLTLIGRPEEFFEEIKAVWPGIMLVGELEPAEHTSEAIVDYGTDEQRALAKIGFNYFCYVTQNNPTWLLTNNLIRYVNLSAMVNIQAGKLFCLGMSPFCKATQLLVAEQTVIS